MVRALILTLSLALATLVAAWAQPPRTESPEPPIAEGMTDVNLQQAGAQFPQRPAGVANTYQTPTVTVTVIAPQNVAAGKDIEYKLRVENTSQLLAKEVQVINPLPKGGKLVNALPPPKVGSDPPTWDIGNLAAGAKKEIAVVVSPGPDMGEWKHEVRVRFEHGRTATTKIAKPDLDVKVMAPIAQQFGTTAVQLSVTNSGMEELKDIQVTMQLPDGLVHQYDTQPGQTPDPLNVPQLRNWKIERLAPREVKYLPCRVLVEKSGGLEIVTTAKAGAINREVKTKLTASGAKLDVAINGPTSRGTHEIAKYLITVKNSGSTYVQNIRVTDKLPANCEVIKASDNGQVFGNDVQWIIAQMAPNETRVLELQTKASQAGRSQHQFTASSRGISETRTHATDYRETAALRFDVRAEQDTARVNDMVHVSILVENTGSAPATNVRPVLILPASLGYVSGDPISHRHDGGRVSFESGTVPAGGKQKFSVTARALRAALPAIVSAEITADQLEGGAVRRQESIAISDPKGTAPPP